MRLRTKLFLIWGGIMLLIWAGAFWSIHGAVKLRIEQMAHDAFDGTKRSLDEMQKERITRMQQAGRLFMSIPELRALIAEQNSELSPQNLASLKERLDYLEKLLDVNFVAVIDGAGQVVAQSGHSPWTTIGRLNDYCRTTQQPLALIQRVFTPAEASDARKSESEPGLWQFDGHIFQVVAVPLLFQQEQAQPEGALVLGEQISDTAAAELGRSHQSQITFFAGDSIVASSLSPASQNKLAELKVQNNWQLSSAFVLQLDGTLYHGSIEPLRDPSSNTTVGTMLIQCDQQDALVENSMLQSLVLTMLSGLALTGIGSFLVSAAITHPVQALVAGVQRVAEGDLDLTLSVKRRDELGELSASFNNMVSQLRSRRDLEHRVEEAQSASRAKSGFLANMSHEIRTPLNGVIGMTELLMATELSEQQRRYACLVKTSAELLTTQINDILDFSKIEAGKLEIQSIDFNLYETVEGVIELLSEKASRKNVEVASHFQSEVPRLVRGDPDRLRQILVNLVNNAIKFTAAGSIVVRVAAHADAHGLSMVRFSITDTGIGIPKDRLDRLFKPFSQVDASTTRKYGGTGLGLAISKQLAELMGGEIGVQSEPDHGSTFWFTVRLEKQKTSPETSTHYPFELGAMRVLAIDDSQMTRAILEEQLASWGLQADSKSSAADALAALRHAANAGNPYRVAIIDSDLPETNGFELARRIKSDEKLSETVLMLLMPIEASIDSSQLQEAGFAGYMTKPVRQSQLFDSIMKAVARQHATSLRKTKSESEQCNPDARRAGARILVAEDNEVNQIVVRELLIRAGHRCHVVDNGRKAIEAAMTGGFDLVLMDCQMPELDGFEATGIIRQKEATGSYKRIPIIALTANALKGDREACLAAGMDAHCAKPIDARQLLSQIDSLLGQLPITHSATADSLNHCSSPENLSELPAIVVDTLLERCMNNLATVDVVMRKFETQVRHDIQQIEQSIAGNDLSAATRTAHALKGAASMLAANRLADVASEIEQLGRQEQIELMQKSVAELNQEVQRCLDYLPHVRAIASQRLSARTPGIGV